HNALIYHACLGSAYAAGPFMATRYASSQWRENHFGGKSSSPPSRPHCDGAIDAFAALHAFWWDHPALHTIDTFPSQESAADEIAGIQACFPGFADFAGDRLSMPHRRVFDRVLASLPLLLQRSTCGEHLTLIHGDANLSNVLLPHDPATGTALIIDWQLWGIRFAAEDLANLMALFWNKDQRHSMERGLLMRYYENLVRFGVRNYTWADCWYDYRLAVIVRVLFMPMWFWHTGAPSSSVWPSLENAMQAFDDLDCLEIL
ncbi:MAG: phosphotransferase, partial [Chloroflexi bacterium]|nr:phosphotransferase [Chloroflexota bacterium]